MKKPGILIILCLLMTLSLMAKDNYTINSNTFTNSSKDGRLSVNITYLEISGISDKNLQKKLNDYIKKEFLTGYKDIYGKDVNFEDDKDFEFCYNDLNKNFGKEYTFAIEIEPTAVTCKNSILSVASYGLGILTPSAHPTKLPNAFTIDLRDGKVYTFKDLFKPGSNYMAVIEKLIKKHGYYIEKDGKTYNFFLTETDLVLLNINGAYVGQGEAGAIKFGEIKDIINPNGPIGIITGK